MFSRPSYSGHRSFTVTLMEPEYAGGASTHSDAQQASIDVPLDRAWLWSGASVLLASVVLAALTWL